MHCGERLTTAVPEGDSKRRMVCMDCGFVHYLNPRPVAGTIPVRADGKTVLGRRDIEPRRGFWVFPGGYMDLGETAEEAAVRETREELQLEVRNLELLGVFTRVEPGVVVIVYEAPDDESAAAVALAVAAGGAVRSAKTTKLLTGAQWVASLKKAGTVGAAYKPSR